MSGGWWCAAVVIRAIERQDKNAITQTEKKNDIETINGSEVTSAKRQTDR